MKSIEYEIAKRIDTANLVKKCKENAFEVVSFKPEKGKESITVTTGAWLQTTIFRNEQNSSEVYIMSGGIFPNDFYSTLNPENIIKFLQNCLE